jgi:hypothetical protein
MHFSKFIKLAFILIVLLNFKIKAQQNQNPLTGITVGFHYGSMYIQNKYVKNTEGAKPIGIELLYTKQLRDEKSWQQNRCYFNSGIGINYFNYNNSILGQSASLFYIFEPQVKLGKKLKIFGSTNLGLTFLTNPHKNSSNNLNLSYSLPISFNLVFGAGIQYPLSKNFQLGLAGHFVHISNGGLQEPNRGVNLTSINLRLTYNPSDNELKNFIKKPFIYKNKSRLDLGFYGSNKNIDVNDDERFFIFGFSANYSKQIGRFYALTSGLEVLTDKVTEERLKRNKLNKSNIRSGLLVGQEFLFGRFVVSQQLGYYLINDTKYFNEFYQRAGVCYYTRSNIAFGFSLLTHTYNPNFMDIRLLYSFNK